MPNNPLAGRILLPACFTVSGGFVGGNVCRGELVVGIVGWIVGWADGLIRIVCHSKTSSGSFEPSHPILLSETTCMVN